MASLLSRSLLALSPSSFAKPSTSCAFSTLPNSSIAAEGSTKDGGISPLNS
ncbi:hypothetical protein D3C87_1941170 [compost metagenome]